MSLKWRPVKKEPTFECECRSTHTMCLECGVKEMKHYECALLPDAAHIKVEIYKCSGHHACKNTICDHCRRTCTTCNDSPICNNCFRKNELCSKCLQTFRYSTGCN